MVELTILKNTSLNPNYYTCRFKLFPLVVLEVKHVKVVEIFEVDSIVMVASK